MKDSLQNSPAGKISKIQKKKKSFLLKEAAKKIVSDLRKRSPFFSEALNAEIFVTKKYLQHILYTKKRDNDETEERLLISVFVDVGIKEGKLFSSRHEENGISHELHYSLKQEKIGIIIIESKGDFFVISAFLKHKKKHFV